MNSPVKGIILIIDGLGDRPSTVLGGATPLEAAHTPNLNQLLSHGQGGLVDPFIPGMPVGTHTGTSMLMGVAPRDVYEMSRGPIEALGVGIPIQPGDVALRCNFATLEPENDRLRILDRRAGRIRHGREELAAALNNIHVGRGLKVTVYPATQHRGVVLLSGPNLSQAITDTDPGERGSPLYVQRSTALNVGGTAAPHTAKALNTFIDSAHRTLRDHPVNEERRSRDAMPATGIITRGAGILRQVDTLQNHLGMKVAVVAGERTLMGLAKLYGYTAITDTRFTSLPDTDLDAKVELANTALEDHDLAYLHIKGTDTCSHDQDPEGKARLIERIDAAIAPLLVPERVVGISADHSTDSTIGCHCGDPVPSIFYAPNGRRDGCQSYGETSCMAGGLGRISANAFLLTILDAMVRLPEYRITDAHFLAPH